MSEQDPRSITAVVHGIANNVEDLVHAQVRLAKAELREGVRQTAQAAKLVGIGAALGQLAVGFILLACVNLLATRLPLWASALIVGGVVGVIAIALLAGGLGRLKHIDPAHSSLVPHGRPHG